MGTLSVSAADPYDATITVADVPVTIGDTSATAVLNISVVEPGINEAIFNVTSDIGTVSDVVLDLESLVVDSGDAYVDAIQVDENTVDFSKFILSAREATDSTELNGITAATISVTFTVKDGIVAGTYPISIDISGVKAADKNETVINYAYTTANFVVTEPVQEHVHNVIWTSDNAGNHTSSCDAQDCPGYDEAVTEACVDGDDDDNLCDYCGYDLTPATPECEHTNAAAVVTTRPTKDTTGLRTYTCECGHSWTEAIPVATLKTTADDSDLYKIGHNLDLQSQILVGYQFRKSLLDATVDAYALFEKDLYDVNGNVTGKTDYSYSSEAFIPHPTNTARYLLQFDGATAKEMASEIRADFYFEMADGSFIYLTDTYTVATFATSAFDVYGDAFNTLLVDMLNYGTAAQNFFGYNTANPANKAFDVFDEYADCASTAIPEITPYSSKSENAGENYKIALSRQLNLESAINVAAAIRNTDKTAYSGDLSLLTAKCVYTTLLGEEETVYINDFIVVGGMYYVNFNKFAARQLNSKVTIEIYEGETLVSDTVSYSIGSYYNALKSYADTNTEKILAEKLVKYSAAAQAYFG